MNVKEFVSQCTFWCSVLSDGSRARSHRGRPGLNAPFGAQCFPTAYRWGSRVFVSCLNAPFGAQCFPTSVVLRRGSASVESQCTFWCSVLSDKLRGLLACW